MVSLVAFQLDWNKKTAAVVLDIVSAPEGEDHFEFLLSFSLLILFFSLSSARFSWPLRFAASAG